VPGRRTAALGEAAVSLRNLIADDAALANIAAAGELLANAFAAGGRAYSCGNGGSMCDAMHFAEELTGRFRDNRPGYAALAISDPSHLSCVGTITAEQVFALPRTAAGATCCSRSPPAAPATMSSPQRRRPGNSG
jgi:phosphoheptose isomerase